MINLVRKTLQIELFNFTKIGQIKEVSKQAFSKARRKLDPIVFLIMNQTLIKEFYKDNEVKTFRGFRVLSIDGTTVQLPSSNELINYYGVAKNQHKAVPIARASTLFDVLNKVVIDGSVEPYKTSERNLAIKHIKALLDINKSINFNENNFNDLLLFDRGYPSIQLLVMLFENKQDFIMRCSTSFLGVINNAVKNGKIDQIIEICFSDLVDSTKAKLKQKGVNFDKNKKLKVRVLLFKLKSGEQEILLTSLLDQQEYSPVDFFNLYNKRWDIEENYKFHKSIADIENFSGKSKLTVEQDYFATIFTCNIATLLMQEAQDEINEALKQKNCKYEYKINRNIGLGLLKNDLIETILSNKDLSEFCDKVKNYMQKNMIPIRPGRSFSRKRSKFESKKHPINRRSSI